MTTIVWRKRGQELLTRVTKTGGDLSLREALVLTLYLYPEFLTPKPDYAIAMDEADWEKCRSAIKDAMALVKCSPPPSSS